MGTFRIYRRLQDLQDVDPNGLPDGGVPAYDTNVSSFVVGVPATLGAFSMGVTDSGNTGGDTGVTGPRVGIVGSGNVTVLQSTDVNGGTITISAAGGAGGDFSAGVSGGNTQGDTGLTGTNLALAGGNNITLSQVTDAAGATITISGPNTVAQTVQTQNLFDLTAAGNTAGVLALVSSGTLTLAGGQSITLSQNGNAITISGASTSQSVQTQPIQTGISSIVASNATYTSGSVQFTGSNMITVRSSANQRVVIDATQSVQTQNVVDVTLSGNTAGALALVSSGTLTLAGGNNITVSQAGNAITISGPNVGGAQTGISGIANSQTTFTSGTVSLSELGAITIRSTTGNQFQFSVAPQSVQPGIQNLIASDATFSSGTVTISGFGDVTVNTAANLIRISAPVQTVESQSFGMSNLGNTSGTTGIASGGQVRFLLAGGNNITLSQSINGASGTITISAPNAVAQTNQTLGMYAVQNTTGQSSSTTMDARTLSVAGDGAVSVGYSAGSLRISAPTQTVESQSIGMSNIGNTSGTTGVASGGQVRFVFAGGNNITLSQSLNGASGTITISAPNLGAGAMSAGVSNLGNSAGATGITGTQLVLVGSDNITLSQTTGANGGTVSIIGGAGGGFSAGASTDGNTAGATGVTGTRMVFVGTNAISLSQTTGAGGGTLSIDAPATSSLLGLSGVSISTNGSTISVFATSGGPFVQEFNPYGSAPQTNGAQGQATLHIQPMQIHPDLRMDRILLGGWISNASNSSNSITLTNWIGIYTRTASTLSLVTSISTSTNFSGSGTAGSYSLYGGRRWMSAALTTTLSAGDYYLALGQRSTTGGGAGHTVQQILMTQQSNATFSGWSGVLGDATAATMQNILGLGVYTVSTAGVPSSIGLSQINGSGTLAMMPPMYALRSGTV